MQWPFAFLVQEEQKQSAEAFGYNGVCMKQQTKLRAQNITSLSLHTYIH
ncbi:hypothetical protein GCM10007893_28130 [Paracoccus marinus]|nr:hypothetical protein GCM10007893_28130 [Paracoccus marinus]